MDYTQDRFAVYVAPNWRLYACFQTLDAARVYCATMAGVQVRTMIWDRALRAEVS